MKVGILGGGQLARMMALAALPLGIETVCFEPQKNTCANNITNVLNAEFEDTAALEKFAAETSVITYETENIPLKTAQFLRNQNHSLHPDPDILETAQDRLHEKSLCLKLDIATAEFAEINSLSDLVARGNVIGYPAVLKTRRMGYDGKGQFIIQSASNIEEAWQALSTQHNLILEKWIKFDRELSLIAVRNKLGNIYFYDLIENQHKDGILRLSIAPYHDPKIQQQAQDIAHKIMSYLNYIGVLVIEFFQVVNILLVNEMAPRVHNSGHWTIEGAATSQFENHLRAILDLPLGDTRSRYYSAMINCIGSMPPIEKILRIPDTHYHDYQKKPRPNRKVGHITLLRENKEELQKAITTILEQF